MQIKFVPQDLWIGLYWKTKLKNGFDSIYGNCYWWETTYYLCVIPCFPIIWSRAIEVPEIVIQGLGENKGSKNYE